MDKDKGDTYNSSGQAGAAGPHANSHHNTFNQTNNYNQVAPVPPLSALHQLPPPPRDFVGRSKEMTELLQALETSGVTISGLQGLGGVGKTALALKLAAYLKPKYPDAQFYLDLKGVSSQPLSANEAMAHVIRAYHPAAQLPDDENSLRGLYLSVLENQKALLVMDNAADGNQVKPLIPPENCILLVTSRNHFTLSGFFVKRLDTLEAEDAEKLLLKIAPRIGTHAGKIAKLCGYLPLALELAASALHKLVMLTPEEYVKRLSKATKRLELIEASLSLSYDLLNEEMQTHWRKLSVFLTTFDTAAVAALWGLEIEETQDRLAELISYSLIEWTETTHRYRFHDLVRLFADARLSETERHSAKQTHASYYKNLLAQADDCYFKGRAEMLRGLALFDLERENIEAGQRWSAAWIGADDTATELSLRYYSAGLDVLDLRLHPRERISWLEVTLQAARLLEDKSNEGAALSNLGNAYWYLGEYRKAIEFYEQDLEIVREIGERRGEGIALGNLGIAYSALGETHKAIEFFEQYLEIARQTGNQLCESSALSGLGDAYATLGEYRKALELYEQSLEIAREISDRQGEGIRLGCIGNAYAALHELGKAIEYLEQYLQIVREIGDRRSEGNALWDSALAYDKLGDRTQAISRAEMALAIFEQIENPGIAEDRATVDRWKAEEGKKRRGGEREKDEGEKGKRDEGVKR